VRLFKLKNGTPITPEAENDYTKWSFSMPSFSSYEPDLYEKDKRTARPVNFAAY